jgi:hypothetical protein
MTLEEIGGKRVASLPPDGDPLGLEASALDVIGQLFGQEVDVVAIPVVRMRDDFWQLRNGLLGGFAQKFTNYRLRLAFVGDLTPQIASSTAFAAYVIESNRRRDVLFVPSSADLHALL